MVLVMVGCPLLMATALMVATMMMAILLMLMSRWNWVLSGSMVEASALSGSKYWAAQIIYMQSNRRCKTFGYK